LVFDLEWRKAPCMLVSTCTPTDWKWFGKTVQHHQNQAHSVQTVMQEDVKFMAWMNMCVQYKCGWPL